MRKWVRNTKNNQQIMRPDGWADAEWHITIVLNELETPLTTLDELMGCTKE